jgi:ubiquitin-conjugating enzyme E2 variant
VKATSETALRAQAIGAGIHVGTTVLALRYLRRERAQLRDNRFTAVSALALGTFGADVVSGLLHWAFDSWFDETVTPVSRMVYIVREHHLRPARVLQYRLRDEAGILSWFAVALASPLYLQGMSRRSAGTSVGYAKVLTGVSFANELVLMLEFHKFGHRARRGRVARALQRGRLLLSPEEHLRHHSGRHDENYCLITGIADRTMGRFGLFRGLETVITAATGQRPRVDDLEWGRRYGRPA